MSVRNKLMLSFLVITALVVISGVVGYTSLNSIKSSINNISNNDIPQKTLISKSVLDIEKTISDLKSYAMSYKNNSQLKTKIDSEINKLTNDLKKLSSKLDKTNSKNINAILIKMDKFKNIINELVSAHSQKTDLYFYIEDRLFNVETYFYYITNIDDSYFNQWYKNNKIKNKRIKKYLVKYVDALNKNNIKQQKKYSSKIIKTASRTIAMVEHSERLNFETLMKHALDISSSLQKIEQNLEANLVSSQNNIDSIIGTASIFNIVSALIAIVGGIAIAIFTSKNIVESLNSFQNSLLGFFSFVNKETKHIELIEIKSNDEFGQMAMLLNENIQKTKKGLDENQKLIDEVVSVAHSINEGHLDQTIKSNTSDETLNTLKTNFNSMLRSLQSHVTVVLDTFKEFENNNFTRQNKLDCEGEVMDLLQGVNSLGKEISDMLIDNMKNGLVLEKSSQELVIKVDDLSISSNQQANDLKTTASQLDNITTNIRQTTTNAIEMANYADEVKVSVTKGQQLASQTASSMEEINEQVVAISDAIGVIDQIAFQTNILSLNAAVEAATAGEAGKGFAVVAQEVRNLASRSAEAAKEIKELVEKATSKANLGKTIATDMIDGYTILNNNIGETISLIDMVSNSSKEQQNGIELINNTINEIDKKTQNNANISLEANNIAKETSKISHMIVTNAQNKEFIGKDSV
ncbi:MAG: methyl-accepting chemotaxis protein [Campylobacterota bacterium]|nr:methyl-accepting chemotaxis protein [Campylobacterota bacterium]